MKPLCHHDRLRVLSAEGSEAPARLTLTPLLLYTQLGLLVSIAGAAIPHNGYTRTRKDTFAKIPPSLDTWKTICKRNLHQQLSRRAP